MSRLVLTITNDDRTLLESAAEYGRLPISLWARGVLIAAARSIEHKKLCTPKALGGSDGITYQWAGHPCTKAEMEAGEKRLAKAQAAKDRRDGFV